MSNVKVRVHKTDLESNTAKAVSDCLKNNSDKNVLLLLSGGSALKMLDHIDPEALGKNVTISLLDERFTTDPEVSNFIQLTRTEFYKKANTRNVSFISILAEKGESLEVVANNWEKAIRNWYTSNPKRMVVAIMGIGSDGHTAGIMPYPEDPNTFASLFENKDKWIVGYDAGKKNQFPERMTASISFFKNIVDQAFVYVSGESKRKILNTILKSNKTADYPSSVINSMKSVEVFTDID